MTSAVHIDVQDAACAASIVQACERADIAVDEHATLIITDDSTALDKGKRTIMLGGQHPADVAAHFTLPVSLVSLMERTKQLLEHTTTRVAIDDIVLDISARMLSKATQSEELTNKETQLMQLLMQQAEKVVSRETLLHDIWGYQADIDTHTLETHIYRLRGKCEALKSTINIDAQDGGYILTS